MIDAQVLTLSFIAIGSVIAFILMTGEDDV